MSTKSGEDWVSVNNALLGATTYTIGFESREEMSATMHEYPLLA